MAQRLAAAGLHVAAWKRTAEKAQALAADGARGLDAGCAAVGASVLVTMLAYGAAVQEAVSCAGREQPHGPR